MTHQAFYSWLILLQPDQPPEQRHHLGAVVPLHTHLHSPVLLDNTCFVELPLSSPHHFELLYKAKSRCKVCQVSPKHYIHENLWKLVCAQRNMVMDFCSSSSAPWHTWGRPAAAAVTQLQGT